MKCTQMWVRIPLIFPTFFPFYLSSSPSDLHTPPFFQSTRREIGSETTDYLSEGNPVKNATRANAKVLTNVYLIRQATTSFSPMLKGYTVEPMRVIR